VTHLRGGVEPALQMEFEVVSAGAAVRDQRRNNNEREQWKQYQRQCSRIAHRRTMHGVQLNRAHETDVLYSCAGTNVSE
jgi:hypothetical protein